MPALNKVLELLSRTPAWLLPSMLDVLTCIVRGDVDGAAAEARRSAQIAAAKAAIRLPLKKHRL